MTILFYDFEVFEEDWLVVLIEPETRNETVIVNDEEKLRAYYEEHKSDIWVGFNSRHYDQYILKGILLGMNPKKINDRIIIDGFDGWQISNAFRDIPLYNYDVMTNIDRGLKYFEGSLGNSIEESSVPFDIDRKLTEAEIQETIKYCRHDVEQTIEVFMERYSDFEAQLGLIKMFGLPLSDISRTKVQLSAKILEASKKRYDDEFDIDFPDTMRIEKYKEVVDWYGNPENHKYNVDPKNPKSNKHQLKIDVAGVPHSFGWGGVHGARENYIGTGHFVNMDVASLYPSLMIRYDLISRSCNPEKFKDIVATRLKYKAEKNPLQAPLKIVINGTYGASKDKNNPLYDPRQANKVCIYGQLLLLDLIEHLEPVCEIIQSNTDGVLVKLRDGSDEAFYEVDDIAYEWEERTGLKLEFDEYVKVIQKDVNNYIIVAEDGHWKSKGAYVKKLGNLDYDLSIVNKAVSENLVNNIPVEKTINECKNLKEFQLVKKVGSKYVGIYHGEKFLAEKCVRCFASKDKNDGGLTKLHAKTCRRAKIEGTPLNARLVNGDVNGMSVPDWLDRDWYIEMAKKRVKDFIGKNPFDHSQKLRVLSLFSGIGGFEKALENLKIDFELVNFCEIDKYASKAYSLIHDVPEELNLGDITKVDRLPSDIDLVTYGFPCQDISLAGYQRGFEHEGEQTRSGLFFEALRIIKDVKPKFAIAENVKNLTSKRFEKEFQTVLTSLDEAGYNNYWKVLNSKDYGIPQNRERVFIVSIRKDIDDGTFEFPQPELLFLRLKDMLEESVDERYFMSEKAIAYICSTGTKNFSYKPEIDLEIARPLTSTMHKSHRASQDNYVSELFQKEDIKVEIEDGRLKVPEEHRKLYVRVANSRGYDEAEEGDTINFEQPSSKTRRGRVGKQIAQTLNTAPQQGVVESSLRVRKLTPKECFRLMGFDDRDVDILIENKISNTQLYKMAGNSIVVNVLEGIFKNLLGEKK